MNSRAAYSIVQAGTRDARVFGNILTVTFYLVRYGCFVDDSDAKQFVHRAFLEASDHDTCVVHNSQSFETRPSKVGKNEMCQRDPFAGNMTFFQNLSVETNAIWNHGTRAHHLLVKWLVT